MSDDIVDLLQIKIEKAKRELPEETQNAIAAVDWRATILNLRAGKGYNFEQLGELELETELLLCGLLTPDEYPKELAKRMNISKMEVDEIVNKMNESVFAKIRVELIKNTERKKIFTKNRVITKTLDKVKPIEPPRVVTLKDITTPPRPLITKDEANKLPVLDLPAVPSAQLMQAGKLEIKGDVKPIFEQKLSSSFQIPTIKTDHSLNNISKLPISASGTASAAYPPKADPYRLPPE